MSHARKECSVDGCHKPSDKRGWCSMHYSRWRVHGDLNFTLKAGNNDCQRYLEDVAAQYCGDDCLIWPHGRNKAGYAVYKDGLASRYICSLENGPPPTAKHEAAHSCGNGAMGCVARKHLTWKTRRQNEADKILHGTSNRGERSGHAKLTNEQAKEIKAIVGALSDRKIAAQYGVSATTIAEIRRGTRWAWLETEAA